MFQKKKKYVSRFGTVYNEPPLFESYEEITVIPVPSLEGGYKEFAYDKFGRVLGEVVYDPMTGTERIRIGYCLNEYTNTIETEYYNPYLSLMRSLKPVELRRILGNRIEVYDKVTGEYLGEAILEDPLRGRYRLIRRR